jgi:hypothetical protein
MKLPLATAPVIAQLPPAYPSFPAWDRGVAQLGRAPALGAGCRRFESCLPDHPSFLRRGATTIYDVAR